MISEDQAHAFVDDWISSWNAHHLERIIAHYDENVEYHSPFLLTLADNPSGTLQGRTKLKTYLAKGLETYPELHFELLNVFVGVSSLVIQYKSVKDLLASEVFELNDKGLAVRVQCHYFKS